MRKERVECVRGEENYFAQILNEADEWSSQCVKKSSEHLLSCLELEINQIAVPIDFVTQAGNGRELMVELQDLVQVAQTSCVSFQFEHLASNYERHTLMQKETRDCAGHRAE